MIYFLKQVFNLKKNKNKKIYLYNCIRLNIIFYYIYYFRITFL